MRRNQNLLFFSILGPNLLPKNQKPKLHNSSKIKQKKNKLRLNCRVFQMTIRNGEGGIRNFAGGNIFTGQWEPGEEWFWPFEPFLKLETDFCEFWTSIKIKISMTCVSKDYEIRTKMVHEQWLQLKMLFYWVITWKLWFSGN